MIVDRLLSGFSSWGGKSQLVFHGAEAAERGMDALAVAGYVAPLVHRLIDLGVSDVSVPAEVLDIQGCSEQLGYRATQHTPVRPAPTRPPTASVQAFSSLEVN